METKAIITGDLIGSTAKGQDAIETSMGILAAVAARLSLTIGSDTCFTRHRGDGWQIYLNCPGLSLRAVLLIAAELRAGSAGLTTRQSVGLGTIQPLTSKNLSSASGAAFEASGSCLDEMGKEQRLSIAGRRIVNSMHEAIFALADWHSARWSREQAEAMALALSADMPTRSKIAKHIGISRQAVDARLSGAGYAAWQESLWAFETHNWDELADG
jgi:hypothetical protein